MNFLFNTTLSESTDYQKQHVLHLQCTTIGPALGMDCCLAFTS